MALIGDVLISLREAATDIAGLATLSPPGAEIAITQVALANTMPTGTYVVGAAYRTPWGETLLGATVNIIVNNSNTIQVALSGAALPVGVTAIVLYFSSAGGASLIQYLTLLPSQLPFIVLSPAANTYPGQPGSPRVRSTAYLPDSDGNSVSAFTLYRWLNKGLEEAAAKCGGGMPDFTGVPSVSAQGVYQLTNSWWKLDQGWYDGYPMSIAGTTEVFRKNTVTGSYAMALVAPSVSDRVLIEIWPQPSRTAGQSTLTNPLTTTTLGAVAMTAGATSFVGQADGLVQIGTEICMYSGSPSNTSVNLILRGIGGTLPQAWSAGTVVNELNIFLHGLRVAPQYSVGQAFNTLNVPPGWQAAMDHYLLHRYRMLEKDAKRAQDEYKQFEQIIKEQPLVKPVGGPRQIQIGGARGAEVAPNAGGFFGGVIVP